MPVQHRVAIIPQRSWPHAETNHPAFVLTAKRRDTSLNFVFNLAAAWWESLSKMPVTLKGWRPEGMAIEVVSALRLAPLPLPIL